MMLQKYDPFARLAPAFPTIDRFLKDAFGDLWEGNGSSFMAWAPAVNVREDEEKLSFEFEVPGLSREQLRVRVENGVLTVEGERKREETTESGTYHRVERSYGAFCRSFVLPTSVDADQVSAELKDGILFVALPKKPEARPKSIEIRAAH